MTFKILKSNNIDIRAKIEGSGPWRHQISLLSEKGYTVAAIDVRGYGGSSKPYEIKAYSMRELTNDVIGVIGEAQLSGILLL